VLEDYCAAWKVSFNLVKTVVLPIRNSIGPLQWDFAGGKINSVSSEKYLTNLISGTGSWIEHIKQKFTNATSALKMIKGAGLIGGDNSIQRSAMVVRAKVWPVMNSGKIALDIFNQPRSHREYFDKLQILSAREILEVSNSAPIAGLLGELGWMSTNFHDDTLAISFLRRLLAPKPHTLPRKLVAAMINTAQTSTGPIPSFMSQALNLIQLAGTDPCSIQSWYARTIAFISQQADNYWLTSLMTLGDLKSSYPVNPRLQMQFYLKIDSFPGRRLITKVRINDLPLHRNRSQSTNPICPCCSTHCAETMQHFLLHCPSLTCIRRRHRHIPAVDPLSTLSNAERLAAIRLVNPPHNNDIMYIHAVGAFLKDIWQKRKDILSQALLGSGPSQLN
jgi:hypothetical protein